MDQSDQGPLTPHGVIGARVKALRKDRGWSAERLAEKMTAVGVPWSRAVVTKLETGRRPGVSVEEMFALAYVLNVAPVHLLVPPYPRPKDAKPGESDDEKISILVTPQLAVPAYRVRQFIRGTDPVEGIDRRRFYAEMPPHEYPDVVWQDIGWRDGERDDAG